MSSDDDPATPSRDTKLRRWWVLMLVLQGGTFGAMQSLTFDQEPFTGRWWVIYGGLVLVMLGLGVGMRVVLQRGLGPRDSSWRSRRAALSWRRRARMAWAAERARAVPDPELARLAIERGEDDLREKRQVGEWLRGASKVIAGLMALLMVPVTIVAVDDWQGRSSDWFILGIVAACLVLAAAFPWLQRRLSAWAIRRAERALAANREVAARGDGRS